VLVLMLIVAASWAKWLVTIVGGWTVERRVTFYALHFVVLRGGFCLVLIFGMLFVAVFVIVFRFLIVYLVAFVVVLMFVVFLDIVRSEACVADEGRRLFDGNVTSALVESFQVFCERVEVMMKVGSIRSVVRIHFCKERPEGDRMVNMLINVDSGDGARKIGH